MTLIDAGAQLVADDQVFLHENDGALFARTPPTIAGMIEMRGIGLLTLPYRRLARVALAIRLDLPQGARLPVQENMTLCGVNLPYLIGNDSLSFPAAVRRHVGQQLDKGSARWPI
ncbi:MAG: aldolase [Paracoccaceae bacterium]